MIYLKKTNKIIASIFAIASFFCLGLILYASPANAIVENQNLSISDEYIGDAYPPVQGAVYDMDGYSYILAVVELQDPYIATYFDYVMINGENLVRLAYDTTYQKTGYWILDNRDNYFDNTGILEVELSGQNSIVKNVRLYYINDVEGIAEYDVDSSSGYTLTHTFNYATYDDYKFKYIFTAGNDEASSFSGGSEYLNNTRDHAYHLLNVDEANTLTANFSTASARTDIAIVFNEPYVTSVPGLVFSRIPSMSFQTPMMCRYGEDCQWDFSYMTWTDVSATATLEILDMQNGQVVASSSIWLNIPFQVVSALISSTTAAFENDIDDYYITLNETNCGDVCSVYWSATGTIVWSASTTEDWIDSFWPDCSSELICSWVSTSTSFWSTENFSCGLVQGACYLLKPSAGSVNFLLSTLASLEDNFPFNSVFGVLNDISNWKTEPISTSSAAVWVYKDRDDVWLGDMVVVPAESLIKENGLITPTMWGDPSNLEEYTVLWAFDLGLNLGLITFFVIQIMIRIKSSNIHFLRNLFHKEELSYSDQWQRNTGGQRRGYEAYDLANKINKRKRFGIF